MSEALSFPGLGLEFAINRVAFSIGNMPIYWYGIIIAAAFLAAAAYALSRSRAFGLDSDRVIDVILCGVLFGIVGARLYYVAFQWDTYADNLMSVFDIRSGGIAVYGGIIGGVIAGMLACKWRKVKMMPMLDLAAGSLFLGQAIGRWGNFVNIEAFGSNTDVPWGMASPSISWYLQQNSADLAKLGVTVDPNMPVHPTFFYESMWCLLGFLFIAWFTSRRRFDGQIWLIYLGWYGLGRFFIEGLRTDSLMLGSMRVSQIVALLCVLASAFAFFTTLSKIRRANDPDYMMLYVNTDEGKSVLAGTFYKKKDQAEQEKPEESAKDESGKSEENTIPDTELEGQESAETEKSNAASENGEIGTVEND